MSSKPRISPQQTAANIDTYLALKNIKDYVPHNPAFSVEAAGAAVDALRENEEDLIRLRNETAAARDSNIALKDNLHQIILGSKNEVRVIFGPDSDEVAAVGLKKKSDRNPPKRKPKPSPDA